MIAQNKVSVSFGGKTVFHPENVFRTGFGALTQAEVGVVAEIDVKAGMKGIHRVYKLSQRFKLGFIASGIVFTGADVGNDTYADFTVTVASGFWYLVDTEVVFGSIANMQFPDRVGSIIVFIRFDGSDTFPFRFVGTVANVAATRGDVVVYLVFARSIIVTGDANAFDEFAYAVIVGPNHELIGIGLSVDILSSFVSAVAPGIIDEFVFGKKIASVVKIKGGGGNNGGAKDDEEGKGGKKKKSMRPLFEFLSERVDGAPEP